MCLVAIALDLHKRFPLVIAANRDEFFDRPADRLAWWQTRPDAPQILGGRDRQAGGTWMGLTTQGRMALLTNVRNPARVDPAAPSRGAIVPLWLEGHLPPDKFWMRVALSGYNDFNLVMADFLHGDCWWASSLEASPRRLERGIYGLSNAGLDTPWPKVVSLKQRVLRAMDEADTADGLSRALFSALSDRTPAEEEHLPATGVPLELERQLSPAFIRTADGRYGTRCSTLVITERSERRMVTHVFERTFTPGPGLALLRSASLKNWPPRYTQGMQLEAAGANAHRDSPVGEREDTPGDAPADAPAASRVVKPRARSLIKPVRAGR